MPRMTGHHVKRQEEVLCKAELVRQKLESLRTQYEEQVQSLRRELEEERRSQGHLQKSFVQTGDSEPLAPGHDATDTGEKKISNAEATVRKSLLEELRSELEHSHQVNTDKLASRVKELEIRIEEQREIIERQREQISAQNEQLEKQKKEFDGELSMRLEAQKITLTGVHTTQLNLIREELTQRHVDQTKLNDLQYQHQTQELRDTLILQAEIEKAEALKAQREELDEKYQDELETMRDQQEKDRMEYRDKLRKELEADHEAVLEEMEARLTSEKDEALSKLTQDLEYGESESWEAKLKELESKHSKALEDLRDELTQQHEERLKESEADAKKLAVRVREQEGRIDEQREVINRQRDEIRIQNEKMEQQGKEFNGELSMRLEAQKITLTGVHTTQLNLIREELTQRHVDQTKLNDLQYQHQTQELKDTLLLQAEIEKAEALKAQREQLDEKYQDELETMRDQQEKDRMEYRDKLKKELEADHEAVLDEMETRLTSEKDEALSKLTQDLEYGKSESWEAKLKELESKHSKALEDLRDELTQQHEERLKESEADAKKLAVRVREQEGRIDEQREVINRQRDEIRIQNEKMEQQGKEFNGELSMRLEAQKITLTGVHTTQLNLIREELTQRHVDQTKLNDLQYQHQTQELKDTLLLQAEIEKAEALKAQREELDEKYQDELETMRDQQEKDRMEYRDKLRKELEADHEAVLDEMETRLTSEKDEALSKLTQDLEYGKSESWEAKLKELESKHSKALEDLRDELAQQRDQELEKAQLDYDDQKTLALAELQRNLEQERDDTLNRLRTDMEENKDEAIEQLLRDQASNRDETFDTFCRDLEQDKEESMEKLRSELEEEKEDALDKLRSELEQEKESALDKLRSDLEQEKEDAIDKICSDFEKEKEELLDRLRSNFQQEKEESLDELRSELQRNLDREKEDALRQLRRDIELNKNIKFDEKEEGTPLEQQHKYMREVAEVQVEWEQISPEAEQEHESEENTEAIHWYHTEVLPEVSDNLHRQQVASEIEKLCKQHQEELGKQKEAFNQELELMIAHHEEQLRELQRQQSGTPVETLSVGEGMLGESQNSSRGPPSPESDFIYYNDSESEDSESGTLSKKPEDGQGHSDDGQGHSDDGQGHSDDGQGHSDDGQGHSKDDGSREGGVAELPRGVESTDGELIHLSDKDDGEQIAADSQDSERESKALEKGQDEEKLSEKTKATEERVQKRGKWRGVDYDESVEVEEDEDEDSWGSKESVGSMKQLPKVTPRGIYYDESVDIEDNDGSHEEDIDSEGVEYEDEESEGHVTARNVPLRDDAQEDVEDEQKKSVKGGWKMVMYGSEEEEEEERDKDIQITSSGHPPDRSSVPIVVVEPEPEVPQVHDFYESINDLDATHQGSDKEWIKHLEARLEEYEDEIETYKEKEQGYEHLVEELEEKLREYQQELETLKGHQTDDDGVDTTDDLKEKISSCEQELSKLKQINDRAEADTDDLKEKVREYEDELSNLRLEAQEYQEDIAKLEERLKSNDEELEQLKSNVSKWQDQEGQDLQEKLRLCEEELTEMKENERSTADDLAEIEAKYKSSMEENNQLAVKAEVYARDNKELKDNVRTYEIEMDDTNKKIKLFVQEVEELKEKLKLCEQEMDEVREEAESSETGHLDQIRELRKQVAAQDAEIWSLQREAEQVHQQHTDIVLQYDQKVKQYEVELARRIYFSGLEEQVVNLQNDLDRRKNQHENEREQLKETLQEAHSAEVQTLIDEAEMRHSEEMKSLEERHSAELKEIEERHEREMELKEAHQHELEEELEVSKTELLNRRQSATDSDAQTVSETRLESELVSSSEFPAPGHSGIGTIRKEYEEKIDLLQSGMEGEIQRKVTEKAQELEAKHEAELEMVRSAVLDYQGEYERLKSELGDSYGKELEHLVDKHNRELEDQRMTLYNKHSEEMTRLYSDLRKEHEMKMIEILAQSVVRNAQDLAMRQLLREGSAGKDQGTNDSRRRETTHDPLQPYDPFVGADDRESLGVEYKEEMRRVQAELEEEYSDTQEELGIQLRDQHRAEMNQMRKDLNREHQQETQRLNSELYSVQEEIETIRADVELQYQADLERLKSMCAEKESEVQHLQRELDDSLEERSKMAALHVEELENLKNNLTGCHDEDVEQLKLEYSNLLQQKDALLEIKLDQERETLQVEMEVERFKMQEEFEKERERIREEYTVEAEKRSSSPGPLDELDHSSQLVPVVEDIIQPQVATLCGDDSEEEEGDVSEVTEDFEGDVEVMLDTHESLTQESSGESLKSEIEAATGREIALSFSSGEEEPPLTSAANEAQPKDEPTDELAFSEEEEDDVITQSHKGIKDSDSGSFETGSRGKVNVEAVIGQSDEVVELRRGLGEDRDILTARTEELNLYKQRLADVTKDFQAEKAKLEQDHQKIMEDFETSRQKEVREMKDKHEQELIHLKETYLPELAKVNGHHGTVSEVPVADLLSLSVSEPSNGNHGDTPDGQHGDTWQADLATLRQDEGESLIRHDQRLVEMKEEHLKELEDVKIKIKEELLAENMRKFEEMSGELERSHQAELDELRESLVKQYEDQIKFLDEELEHTNYEAEKSLREMQQHYEKQLEGLRAEKENLEKQVELSPEDVRGGSSDRTELERMAKQQEEELQELEQEHQQKLDVIEKYHKEAMEKQKLELEQKLASELSHLRDKLEEEKQVELQKLQGVMESQITELKAQLDNPSDNVSTRDVGDEELARRMEQIERLSGLLSERGEELSKAQEEMAQLEKKLEEQKEDYELILSRWEAQRESDNNLERMLRSDIERISEERDNVQHTNDRLLQILSDTVKANLHAEERINKRLAGIVAEGQRLSHDGQRLSTTSDGSQRESGLGTDRIDLPGMDSSATGSRGASQEDGTVHETSGASIFSDEGLDLSQKLNESIFAGPDLEPDGEEVILDAANRLQHAVDRLLDMVVTATRQLHEAQATQRTLLASLQDRTEELEQLTAHTEDLKQNLKDAGEAKAYLAVELNKAEGLIQGYTDEKHRQDEAVRTLEDKKETLIIELEQTKARLTQFEEATKEIAAREDALERQQHTLEQSIGEEEQVGSEASVVASAVAMETGVTVTLPTHDPGLLQELQRLGEEKRDVQRQADKDREMWEARTRELEAMVDDLHLQYEEQLEQKKTELDDLHHQVEVMEKKTKANNLFLEEQTLEREQEREEFQRELGNLQNMVKEKEKSENAEHRLQQEVQELEDQLKEKTEQQVQEGRMKEQLERDLQNQQVGNKTLQEMVLQLEEELVAKSQEESDVRAKLDRLETALMKQQEVSEELSDELKKSVPPDEMNKLVNDLEAQLDTARKAEKVAMQKVHRLEEELRNLKTMEDELQHDKSALQQEVSRQLTEMSTLRTQLEELKLSATRNEAVAEMEADLRRLLQEERDALESKVQEVRDLENQLERFRADLVDKEEEIQQMVAQLEVGEKERLHHLAENANKVSQLHDENKALKSSSVLIPEDLFRRYVEAEVRSLREKVDTTPMPVFAQNLIDEKNQEIDHLNEQLERLQAELLQAGALEKEELETLTREIGERKAEIKVKDGEIHELQQMVETMKQSAALMAEVKEAEEKERNKALATTKEKQYEEQITDLQRSLQEKQNVIDEREEEIFTMGEKLEEMGALQRECEDLKDVLETKQRLLQEQNEEISELEDQLRELSAQEDSAERDRLLQQLQDQDTVIEQLQSRLSRSENDLRSRQEFDRAMDELEKEKEIPHPVVQVTKAIQTQAAPPGAVSREKMDDLQRQLREQLRQEYEEQLQSKIAELESVHSHQVALLRSQFDEQRWSLTEETRREMEKRLSDEVNRLIMQHQQEISHLRHAVDMSDDDSIVEIGRRLNTEIERVEHVEFHRYPQVRPRGVGQDNSASTSMLNGSQHDGDLGDSRLQEILTKVEREGVKVLSLSEMEFLRHPHQNLPSGGDLTTLQQAWDAEKHSLLSAIQSMKDLLAETQRAQDAGKSDNDTGADWRADLLRAISYVFAKERDGLLSELRTHLVTSNDQDASVIRQLEQKISELELHHSSAMKQIFSADRQSMLAEIRDLRAHLGVIKLEKHDHQAKMAEQLNLMEEEYTKRERQLRRQLELMEYKIQQEKVMADDLRSSLEIEKSRTMELSSQLSREKNTSADLQSDLADAETELAKLRDSLEREQSRLLSASSALDEERKKTATLTEALTLEQMSANQYGEELEAERLRIKQQQERNQQITELLTYETQSQTYVSEKLRHKIESEKERITEAGTALERERMTNESLRRELNLERDQHRTTESNLKVKVNELRTSVEMEKARYDELNSLSELKGALQRERQLSAQLRDTLDEERRSQQDTTSREKAAINDLQAMLDLERNKLLDLQTFLERERQKVSQLNSQFDAEQAKSLDSLGHERAVSRQLKNSMESLQVQKAELQRQLGFEEEKLTTVEADRDRLHASLTTAKDQLRHLKSQREVENRSKKQQQRSWEQDREKDRQKQHETDLEVQRLRQRVVDLEAQLAKSRRNEIAALDERDLDRVKLTVTPTLSSPSPTRLEEWPGRRSPTGNGDNVEFYKSQLESLRQRLHLIVIRHQEELSRMLRNQAMSSGFSSRDDLDMSSKPELESMGQTLKEILTELQQVHGAITHGAERPSARASQTVQVPALNEKILQHNSDLTSFVTKLSTEKEDLRQRVIRLEEDLQQAWRAANTQNLAEAAEDRLEQERSTWSRDRGALTLKLHDTEKEANLVRNKLRKVEIQLEREREKYATPVPVSGSIDKEKMQRLYGKYLRAESFRKALIYQKKYLLLLLGGFQDCEEQTLSEIAKMGVYPAVEDIQRRTRHARPYSRFRSVVRVVIAISRMKFLVKKWRRAARMGSPAVTGRAQSSNGVSGSYIVQSSGFTPPKRILSAPPPSRPATRGATSVGLIGSEGQLVYEHLPKVARRTTLHTTPPTRDIGAELAAARIGSHDGKHSAARRQLLPTDDDQQMGEGTTNEDQSLNDYIQRLENIQAQLGNVTDDSSPSYFR